MTYIQWNWLSERTFAPQRYRIGLIVRDMSRPGVRPGSMPTMASEGHADCVLSTGEPIGFFGDTELYRARHPDDVLGVSELVAGASSTGVHGVVWRFAEMMRNRPHYVNRGQAVANQTISTLLAIEVSDSERMRFDNAWRTMAGNPGMFGAIENNCATHAGYAFTAAGLLGSGISAMDTPTNLFLELFRGIANERIETFTGYLGFEPNPSLPGYRISI